MDKTNKIPIFLLVPNNFAHKAGDGTKTRKRGIKLIHPALQANCGATQATYLLELWRNFGDEIMLKGKIVCEERLDEGLRTFKGETIGTIRTIDAGGDKRVIENFEYKDGCIFASKEYKEILNETNEKVDSNDCGYRIRKLTPKECFRLMGFSDDAFERAKNALNDKYYNGKEKSNSQLYKQAGNSIVTDVLFYIFKELYLAMPYLFDDLKVSSYFSGIGAFEVALDRLFVTININNTKVKD